MRYTNASLISDSSISDIDFCVSMKEIFFFSSFVIIIIIIIIIDILSSKIFSLTTNMFQIIVWTDYIWLDDSILERI